MNRENLEKLRDYLWSLPKNYTHFDMRTFYKSADAVPLVDSAQIARTPEYLDPCGTVACAAGHGPAAGIPVLDQENWPDYAWRVFKLSYAQWEWCFDPYWRRIDNTPHGAAARIDWLLRKGLPTDWETQARGNAPLCYQQECV